KVIEETWQDAAHNEMEKANRAVRDATDKAREAADKAREAADKVRGDAQKLVEEVRGDAQKLVQEEAERIKAIRDGTDETWRILKEAKPGGGADIKFFKKDGVTTFNSAKAHLIINDDKGEIEVGVEDGHRTLVAKDADGKVVFKGAIDTPEQVKSVPEQFRK